MFAKTYGATTLGVDGVLISTEVDVSAGLPKTEIVGMPDTAVRESKERVRTAIKNSGLRLRPEKITINLAPADLKKDSAGLDLSIAIGMLAAYGLIPRELLDKSIFTAELSLEGECRSVRGILPMTVMARDMGFQNIFVAPENAHEALLVEGINVYAPKNLAALVGFLTGRDQLEPAVRESEEKEEDIFSDDFSDVQGQFQAKRALEIAAAGGHNVLMVGVPGSGKTMLARRMSSILPELTREEALEVTKIYSIAGLLPGGGLITRRPFRSPHHTASMTSMIGGGTFPRPGEVTLAHNGVLFLDELPEFSKKSLEVLREPVEDRRITISRVNATLTFPTSFILIAAMNPCPCGYHGDPEKACDCSPGEIKRYTRKISGPLLDRIDIHISVPRVKYEELSCQQKAEPSSVIRARVVKARQIERERLKRYNLYCNAQMNHALIQRLCPLEKEAAALLEAAFRRMNLSARSYDRIIKVARTAADLAGKEHISAMEIAEAIKLRSGAGIDLE